MSASQDNLLNLDSSVDVVVEYERVLGPSSPKFSCEEADLFDSITNSQLLCYAKAPTQEENPEESPEVEKIPPPEKSTKNPENIVMNSKGEWGRQKLTRIALLDNT